MTNASPFPQLVIPNTLAAGPGPGNTDARVLQAYAGAGIADHMQPDVLRGMIECKHMLRTFMGTKNIHTFGVAGTGWSGLDCMMSAVMPGDTVVAFSNGTFSGIDALTLRMKASTREELAADSLNPQPASVTVIEIPHGQSVTGAIVEAALAEHNPNGRSWRIGKPVLAGSTTLKAFRMRAKSMMRWVSSTLSPPLGVEDFAIDDMDGVVGWASCPQKGLLCLPLTYAPVSFTDRYIETLRASGCYTYANHPIMEARHWGIVDGQDVEKGSYHRTHSGYAVSAFHEALRINLAEGLAQRAKDYIFHEKALSDAVTAMGCEVTSNMTSLVVLNLPSSLAGREMELVQNCRAEGFGIWPTLSAPVQIRIGILNLLTQAAITEIVTRFAQAMNDIGAEVDIDAITAGLTAHYDKALAA